MAMKISAHPFSCVATSLRSPFRRRRASQLSLSQEFFDIQYFNGQQHGITKVVACQFVHGKVKMRRCPQRQNLFFAVSQDQSQYEELEPLTLEQDSQDQSDETISSASSSYLCYDGSDGKPGLVSFYRRPYMLDDKPIITNPQNRQNNLFWFAGPAVLVASFVFPSLYLRKILSTVFEDSLLTDFLILFFTEAIFYCGVAVFLLLIDRSRRPNELDPTAINNMSLTPQLGQRISSVAVLVLSLVIPMVTMGLVWPWTGPAASATLAPYLVGIIIQFAFEQYAKYKKSPSWPAVPIIFQVYRLHQLNRAAQLVTALSFTVRGAEMTPHNLAINNSLGTLLNVLQCLGIICIWSLASFLMRFFPSSAMTSQ